MTADVLILPVTRRPGQPSCQRCGDSRRVTFDQLTRIEQSGADFGSLFPCPNCAGNGAVLPFPQTLHPITNQEP